jgi:hypothetical protein
MGAAPGWDKQNEELYKSTSTTPSFVVGGAKDDYCGKVSDPTGQKFGALISEASRAVRVHSDGHMPFPEASAEATALAEEVAAFMKAPAAFLAEEPGTRPRRRAVRTRDHGIRLVPWHALGRAMACAWACHAICLAPSRPLGRAMRSNAGAYAQG